MDVYRKKKVQQIKQPNGRPPQWTEEFMYMVASKVVDEGMKYREASELFGVSHGSINAWRKRYQKGQLVPKGLETMPDTSKNLEIVRMQEQIRELKAEIGDLYLHNQLLKKAMVTSQMKRKENSSVITPNNLAQFQKGVK